MTVRIKELFLKSYHNRFFRFLFVGGINSLFGYGVFSLFIFLKIHYSLACFLATVLGVLFNFKTTGYFVFRNKDNKLIIIFFGVYAFIYFMNVGFLAIFNHFKVSNYVAGAILLFPMAIISFLLNKNLVFRKTASLEIS